LIARIAKVTKTLADVSKEKRAFARRFGATI
jgi:hypothetical protein